MVQIITDAGMRLVSQEQVNEQLQQIERRISQIGRLRDGRNISKKVIRTLERINTLQQLDLMTEAEAIWFADRVKQAGKESSENAAAGRDSRSAAQTIYQ